MAAWGYYSWLDCFVFSFLAAFVVVAGCLCFWLLVNRALLAFVPYASRSSRLRGLVISGISGLMRPGRIRTRVLSLKMFGLDISMPNPPTVYVPPATQVQATYVDPGTPFPTSAPVLGTTPAPLGLPPAPVALPSTAQTPQVVTGTILLNNQQIVVVPPTFTAVQAALLFSMLLTLLVVWTAPGVRDALRFAVLLTGLWIGTLVVLAGSPSYGYAWIGIISVLLFGDFWRAVFLPFVRRRRGGL